MKCSFHLTTSGATWYLCLIVLSMLNTCKVVSIKFPHLQVILFPFPDTLLGHHVQYTLQSKGIDFGSYSGEECQRICGFMLKLVQENREKEDSKVTLLSATRWWWGMAGAPTLVCRTPNGLLFLSSPPCCFRWLVIFQIHRLFQPEEEMSKWPSIL